MMTVAVAWLTLASVEPASPLGAWTGQRLEDGCAIARSFGDAARPTTMILKPFPTLASGTVTIVPPETAGRAGVSGGGTITLSPGNRRFPIQWSGGTNAAGLPVLTATLDVTFWDALPAAEVLAITVPRSADIALATGPMRQPVADLKTCSDGLLRA